MSDLRDDVTNMFLSSYDDGRRDFKKTIIESAEILLIKYPDLSGKQLIELLKKIDLDKGRDDR